MTQPLTWHKAQASVNNGQCVQLAHTPDGGTAIRDSKNPNGPTLHFTREEWDTFTHALQTGEFNHPNETP